MNITTLGLMLSATAPHDPDKWRRPPMNLSQREETVITLLAKGLTQKEIALKAFMSVGTVERIIVTLRKRYGCLNSTHLVVAYLETKMTG